MLLSSVVSAANHTKCVSLSYQKCMTQPTLINLHPNKHSKKLHYNPFVVNLVSALEVAILLMTYLINYVFQIKQKIQPWMFLKW